MAKHAAPRSELVLARLIANRRIGMPFVESIDAALGLVASGRLCRIPNSVLHCLDPVSGKPAASLRDGLELAATISADGLTLPAELHSCPATELRIRDRAVLLGAFGLDNGESVLAVADWAITRAAKNGFPLHAELTDFLEVGVSSHRDEADRVLQPLALHTGFVPRHPRLRLAIVVTLEVLSRCADFERELRAVAAIYDVEVTVIPAILDPSDVKALRAFRSTVLSPRFDMLMTASEKNGPWIWRLAREFGDSGRARGMISTGSTEDAAWSLPPALGPIVEARPERPLTVWGASVRKVAETLCSDSFVLTDRALKHLEGNPYIDVERMLDHLTRLARMAEAWSQLRSENLFGTSLSQFALSDYGLTLALQDNRIEPRSVSFCFEGLNLSGLPHVKVDDHRPFSKCGRIYFAIDDRPEAGIARIVVDHVGLHR
jgi:hypothetical protein